MDFEPNEEYRENFRWPDGQILVPYFRVKHEGIEYSSLDMGLGEFSIRLLFRIFAQYRASPHLFVLLDEPDAYLPPITAGRLLARLLNVAKEEEWTLVIATHSEAMIYDRARQVFEPI